MPPKTKRGKENAPPRKKEKIVEEVTEDDFENMDIDDSPPPAPVKRPGRPLKVKKVVEAPEPEVEEKVVEKDREREKAEKPAAKGDKESTLQKRLAAMTAERDRAVAERETYIEQFEELSRLRQSAQETLLEKFKEQTAAVAKAQADVIANQTALNDKLMAKVAELEKALATQKAATDRAEEKAAAAEAPPTLEGKLDGKTSKELHNEVFKLRNTLKAKEEQLTTLQREYEQEVAQSRKLQNQKAARPSVSAAPIPAAAASSEESEKDQSSLALYEDLTGLTILNVRIKKGGSGKEVSFSCMQTVDERSFAFKLRAYNEFDREDNKWTKMLQFTPEGLQYEKDKSFVERLGPFAEGFVLPRDQGQAAWEQLRSRVSRDGVFEDPQGQDM